MHLNDRKRSLPLDRFAALLSVPGLDFVSVQKEVTAEQSALLHDHGVTALGHEFADFADTAAVVAMLDLMVCVDTLVAHVAGRGMGKAVAMLVHVCAGLPLAALGREDSPWYPTMRLFRQTATGDWDGPPNGCVVSLRTSHAARPRPRSKLRS